DYVELLVGPVVFDQALKLLRDELVVEHVRIGIDARDEARAPEEFGGKLFVIWEYVTSTTHIGPRATGRHEPLHERFVLIIGREIAVREPHRRSPAFRVRVLPPEDRQ